MVGTCRLPGMKPYKSCFYHNTVARLSFQKLTFLFKLFQGFATAHGLPTDLFVDDVLGVFLHIVCLLQRLVLAIYGMRDGSALALSPSQMTIPTAESKAAFSFVLPINARLGFARIETLFMAVFCFPGIELRVLIHLFTTPFFQWQHHDCRLVLRYGFFAQFTNHTTCDWHRN